MNEIISSNKHGKGRSCVITRRALFSSSHRYWLPELSAEENSKSFGKCSLMPGHGHNYKLIVSMTGELNQDGMVLNLSEVKHAIKEKISSQLDFACLNNVWPEFDISKTEGFLPTTEALTKVIWSRLESEIPLISLRLYENESLWADYLGNHMEGFLTIRKHFSAAHRLAREELSQTENERIYGKCARTHGHGHNYFVEITVRGKIDTRTGMICDLTSLEKIVEDYVIEPFDHSFLNKDIKYFQSCVPTAENIALYISDMLKEPIKSIGANLHRINLQESPNNAAIIYAENAQLDTLSINDSDS